MRKIIHVITRLDRGGSAENTMLTCLGLADKYDLMLVHGLSLESHMTDGERKSVEDAIKRAQRKGVKVLAIPSMVRSINPFQDLRAFFALWKLMIRERPDMVHTHTSKAGILGRVAARLAGVPIIVHTAHGHVFYGHFGPFASRFFLLVERAMARITDQMVALTEGEKNDYTRLSVFNPEKIVTIHSGVKTEQFLNAKVDIEVKWRSLGLSPKGLVVGTVGWLLPIKGPMHLLKAMEDVRQAHPETSLVYVGKGDLETELRAEVRKTGVSDRVMFLGWRNDIPEIMQLLDVFVLPSLNEGMGRVLVEAMAAGKPIVASRAGGIPDLVRHGRNGFLVEAGNVDDLSAAIKKLLSNKEMREEMGKVGRTMSRNYDAQTMIEKLDVLYASFVSSQ